MADVEFDVDSSIAAGWSRFTDRLTVVLTELADGGEVDITVPSTHPRFSGAPVIRFTMSGPRGFRAELLNGGPPGAGHPDDPARLAVLRDLGWRVDPGGDPRRECAVADVASLARSVVRTLREVSSIPHPAFLCDTGGDQAATPPAGTPEPTRTTAAAPPPADSTHPDFRPTVVDSPDTATRAIGAALAQVYRRDVAADEHDVFAVPAGSALLLVRAHRSLPLVVFTSPLVSHVTDSSAARREVAALNRESLWCRYVFDGHTIHAESELVDRVFVPINFKIRLAEFAAELDDVDDELALRVGGSRWIDLPARPGDDPGGG